jgi:hypothetical protein
MEFNKQKSRLLGKMFEAALKEKMNQLARKYDYDLVFKLWTRITKVGYVRNYFCKWRWKPDMTMREGMECLDDYFLGLETLLQKRQAAGNPKPSAIKNLQASRG